MAISNFATIEVYLEKKVTGVDLNEIIQRYSAAWNQYRDSCGIDEDEEIYDHDVAPFLAELIDDFGSETVLQGRMTYTTCTAVEISS